MYIVEICRKSAELHNAIIQIGIWVKHHRAEPSAVELAFLRDRKIRFRLQFQNASDASAVAQFCHGEVFPERDVPDALAA
jgi:hypothetical protein